MFSVTFFRFLRSVLGSFSTNQFLDLCSCPRVDPTARSRIMRSFTQRPAKKRTGRTSRTILWHDDQKMLAGRVEEKQLAAIKNVFQSQEHIAGWLARSCLPVFLLHILSELRFLRISNRLGNDSLFFVLIVIEVHLHGPKSCETSCCI